LQQSSGEFSREDANACLSAVIARSESDVAIQSRGRGPGLPRRGACHRAASARTRWLLAM